MKNFYSIICFLLIAGFGFAQVSFNPEIVKTKFQVKKSVQLAPRAVKATIWSEDFEGGAMPTGWSEQIGSATQGWTFNTDASSAYWDIPAHTTYACINDDECNCDMSDVWLITSAIDLSAATAPKVSFASFHADYGASTFTLKASIDAGTTWTDVETFAGVADWTAMDVDLATYAGESLTLAFHFNDGASWEFGWCIDDVVVYEPEAHDLGVDAIMPMYLATGETIAPMALVHNYGGTDEATWSITLEDGMGYSETVVDDGTVVAGEDYVVTFPDWTPADGTYALTATVTVTDDAEPANDVLVGSCEVGPFVLAHAGTTGGVNGTMYLGTDSWLTAYSSGTAVRGGTLKGDNLYCVDGTANFGMFDADCNAWTEIGATGITGESFVIAMAYDMVGDMFYTLGLSGSYPAFNINLYSIDATTGVATLIGAGSQTGTLLAIACDNAGNMFGIMHSDSGNGSVYAIDKTDATMTLVGDIGGVVSAYFQSMAFDFDTNICYFQAYDDAGGMTGTYVVDVTTGAATAEGTAYDGAITALGIPYTPVDVKPIVAESNIAVYPNPANNVINVVNAENANIVVINMVGEVVASVENASANQSIDISNLADGTYFVRVNDEVIKINVIK